MNTLEFRFNHWAELHAQGRHDELCHAMLGILGHFKQVQCRDMDVSGQYFIDQFTKTFLALFSEPDFVVPDAHAHGFISSNHVLMNLVAMSGFGTTDAHLGIVLQQQNNLFKVLTLLNARCRTKIDRAILFDAHPAAASLWYAHYACAYYGALQDSAGYANLREHFAFQHPALEVPEQVQEAYFGSTYACGDLDQIAKPAVNRSVRKMLGGLAPPARKTPEPRKVALVSGLWHPRTSVYRIYSESIRALRPKYHLTFVCLGDPTRSDTSMFDEVRSVGAGDGVVDASCLEENDFQVIIFADIGMVDVSVWFANRRYAPIQMALLGHSVSTFGAEIDYFLSGKDVEIQDHPERNYSERLVLLPGMGVVHNVPDYRVQGLHREKSGDEALLVNGLFWSQKMNHPFVRTLAKLLDGAGRDVKLRLFPGNSLSRANDHIPFCRDIIRQLGAGRVEILPPLDYPDYMRMVEQGDLTIDSYPFGGCNTIADSLHAGVPTVTWNSDKWYGRIGSEMLHLAGLDDCIANSEEEFLAISTALLKDDQRRAETRARIRRARLEETVFSKDGARWMAAALDHLIAHHAEIQADPSRKPVSIC